MYKFYGKPFQEVKSKRTNKMLFRFDTKGEFITDDNEIINRAKGYFDCIELKAEVVGEKIKGNAPDRVLIITKKEELKEVEEKVDYSELKMSELRSIAKNKGLKVDVTMKKVDLIKELEG